MLIFIAINLLWLVGGFVTGITSFGGNLLCVPLCSFLMPPKDVILMGYIVGGGICFYLTMVWRRHIKWRETLFIVLCSLPGLPAGIFLLRWATPAFILILGGALVLLFLVWELARTGSQRPQKPCSLLWGIPLGFISGFFTAAISMGGPPVVIYAFLRHWDKNESLASINFSAVIITFSIIFSHWQLGSYNMPIIRQSLGGLAFAALGVGLSVPVINRVNVALFRKLLLATLFVAALAMLVRGFMDIA